MNDATAMTILAGTVLSMTDRGVLRDQAITVAGGRITRVAPRAGHEPTGPVVDWRDRTVLPGLADCHVHVEDRADLLGYLAHGVTLVRNMRGKPWHLEWRSRVAAGAELGPHLVTSTAMADGRGAPGTTVWPDSAQITDRASAHAAVRRWAELGYQQVKAYQWLSAEALAGLGEACRDAGLPLVGHCPQALTVHQAIDRGQTGFEHLNNYEYGSLRRAAQERLDAFFAQGFSYGRGRNRFSPEAARAASDLDDHKVADLAQRLAAENVTSCPTLIVLDRLLGHRDFTDPRLRLTDPVLARTWRPENDFRVMALTPEELQGTADLFHERSRRILAALRDAGAPVLVGTDTHNAFVFHGSSLVEELELMTGAGYTSAELVRLATRGAADYLGLTDRGRVDAGFVADLVAVTGDPLASVTALRDPAAVVVAGTVLERPQLDALLDEVEALVHAEPDRARLRPPPSGERLVGDYERTNFGQADAATRISSRSDGDRTTFREQIATRHGVETRTTVIDASGHLLSADVERRRPEGVEVATVRRDGDRYAVHWTALDGSELDAELPAPLLPAADLGVAALLAAARLAPEGDREDREQATRPAPEGHREDREQVARLAPDGDREDREQATRPAPEGHREDREQVARLAPDGDREDREQTARPAPDGDREDREQATRPAPEDVREQSRWPVLSLKAGLATGLPPVPGTLERDGDELMQRTTDAIVRITGDVAGGYTVQAPMTQLVHHRVGG